MHAYCINKHCCSEYASYKTDYIQSLKQQDEIEKKSFNLLMLSQDKGYLLSPFAAGILTEI